jgi:ACT domain-containing protein
LVSTNHQRKKKRIEKKDFQVHIWKEKTMKVNEIIKEKLNGRKDREFDKLELYKIFSKHKLKGHC